MDWTVNCLGLTTAINLHRSRAGSHLVRIPEKSTILNQLVACLPGLSAEKADRLARSCQDPEFWKREAGYEISSKHLPMLAKGDRNRILEIGCSVGQGVTFLKSIGLWHRLEYLGVDLDQAAVEVARNAHGDAQFEVCDAQQPLAGRFGSFDIVFTKGTICSTYRPFVALNAILDCAAQHVLLIHTACTKNDCGAAGFATTLYTSKDNAYLFPIINVDRLLNHVFRRGFVVKEHRARRHAKNVLNLGMYRLHDLVLERQA